MKGYYSKKLQKNSKLYQELQDNIKLYINHSIHKESKQKSYLQHTAFLNPKTGEYLNIQYDFDKAASVQSGYLPDIDETLNTKKGICFDYAALMTAMLRVQRIPTKLVVGYTGNLYHAWINVYLEGQGWVDNIIYFDGTSWKLMDPTFASSGNQSQEIMQYIGNGANYQAKYSY